MTPELIQAMAGNPALYREHLLIETSDGPRPLAQVADAWQLEDFAALDNGWRGVQSLPADPARPTYRRAWMERPRGHSKSSDIATMASWALLGNRTIRGVAAAADKDQAKLIRNAIEALTRQETNPWLADILDIQNYRVVNRVTGSELEIIASDTAGSYGLLVDFIVVDEIVHWLKRSLWDSLLSAAVKKSNCLLTVITNAGHFDTWQAEIRGLITQDPAWFFSRLEGSVASWITQDNLDEMSRLLPPRVFARLFRNEWQILGAGDAIDEADLLAAIIQGGPSSQWDESLSPYIGSLDIGVRHDRTALVIVALNLKGERVRVVEVQSWHPKDYGGRVPLRLVRDAIIDVNRRYRGCVIGFDASQAELLSEDVADKVVMVRISLSSTYMQQCALTLIKAFHSEKLIETFDSEELLRDLRSVSIVEKNGRWSLVLPRSTEFGHCDAAAALIQILPVVIATRREMLGLPSEETEQDSFSLSHT